MYKRIASLLLVVVMFLGSFQGVAATTLGEDNFDSLSDTQNVAGTAGGTLCDGNWYNMTLNNFFVTTTNDVSAPNAVVTTASAEIGCDFTDSTDDRIYYTYHGRSTTGSESGFVGFDGASNSTDYRWQVAFNRFGNITDVRGDVIQAYNANQMYLVEVKPNYTNHCYRVRIDGGSWSTCRDFQIRSGLYPTNTTHVSLYVEYSTPDTAWWDTVGVKTGEDDTTAPLIAITFPSNSATVSTTTNISASSTDAVGVSGVQFKLDGANLGGEDTSFPYGISWNTASSSNGSHTIDAVSRDSAGNRATSTISVTVANGSGGSGETNYPHLRVHYLATSTTSTFASSTYNLSGDYLIANWNQSTTSDLYLTHTVIPLSLVDFFEWVSAL